MTTVGGRAFEGCYALQTVTFAQGSQLATIGEKAFAECVKLDRIWLPENIDTINQLAFYGCVQLQTAVMPGSIKYVVYNLFDGCQAVKIFVEAAEKPDGWSSFWATSTESQVYWYSATQPAASGNYWHYDSLGAPVVW